jgi:hypothetical protein
MGGGGRVVERLPPKFNGATLFTTPHCHATSVAEQLVLTSTGQWDGSASFLTKNSNFYYLD